MILTLDNSDTILVSHCLFHTINLETNFLTVCIAIDMACILIRGIQHRNTSPPA